MHFFAKLPKIPSFLLTLIILIFFSLAQLKHTNKINQSPTTIGILTQPSFFPEIHSPESFHYIGGCYVNQLKQEGALVVPVIITKSDNEIIKLLSKINGIVIPGGDLNLFNENCTDGYDRFTQVTKLIFDYSLNLWIQNSTIFPVWGTCQGFQSLLIAVSEKKSYEEILEVFMDFNISRNVIINQKIESRLFDEMSKDQLEYSQTGEPFFYWHQYGISPEKFNSIQKLTKYFDFTSTSVNSDGNEFVATFEGKDGIPIYASQFHPERVFVWLPDRNINHSPLSFETNQFFARFFTNQTKLNDHKFKNEDELQQELIEFNNYSLEKVPQSFMLCYFFQID